PLQEIATGNGGREPTLVHERSSFAVIGSARVFPSRRAARTLERGGRKTGAILPWQPRPVKAPITLCREHMICPLPRATDVTALPGSQGWDGHRGGGDDLHPGGRGASHESPRSHSAGVEWPAIVAAGGGRVGGQCADRAAAAPALSARRRSGPARSAPA